MDIYDIATNTWSTGTPGGTARVGHTSVVYNGEIYSWGGNNGSYLNTLDIYDITTGTWSTGTVGGSARYRHTSVLYKGKIYSWGGNNGSGNLNTIDIYDIASNTWSVGIAGGTPRQQHASILYNNKIYSWGGLNNSFSLLNTVDIYYIGGQQPIFSMYENGAKMISFGANATINLDYGRLAITGGNVGIGTTIPQRKLHISDAMRLQPITSAPSSPSQGDLYFDDSDALCVYVTAGWTKLAGSGTCS
jgi:hypothetical protein